jgi:hypothetical protein
VPANLVKVNQDLSSDALLAALMPILAGLSPIAASLIRSLLKLIFGWTPSYSLAGPAQPIPAILPTTTPCAEDIALVVQAYDDLLSRVRLERSPEEYSQCIRALRGVRAMLLTTGETDGN